MTRQEIEALLLLMADMAHEGTMLEQRK